MLDKTPEELEREFKEKIEEIQIQLEEVADHEFSAEILQSLGLEDQTLDSGEEQKGFRLHWVLPTDVSLNTCDNIETTYDAQRAFAEYSFNKNRENETPVSPGDILILTCNHSTIVDEKDENDQPTGEGYFTDACYFVGMCISTEALKVQNLELHEESLITAFEGIQGDAGRQFIAWSTCMGGGDSDCPPNPETIKIDEIVIPEESDDEDVSCLTYTSSGSSLTAKLNELKSLALTKGVELSGLDVKGLIIKGDNASSVGIHTHFDNLRDSITDYDISGYSDKVSLFSQSAVLQETSFKAKTLESQSVSISSDSCGNLLKRELEDESKELSILASTGELGSSVNISALDIQKESDVAVSLGTWELTQLALGEQYNNDKYFIPKITESDFGKIQDTVTVSIASNMILEKTSTSETTDDCTYNIITITPKWDARTLTFKSGVLVEMSNATQQSGAAVTFNCAVCDAPDCGECPGCTPSDVGFTKIERWVSQYMGSCPANASDLYMSSNQYEGQTYCYKLERRWEYHGWNTVSPCHIWTNHFTDTDFTGASNQAGGVVTTYDANNPANWNTAGVITVTSTTSPTCIKGVTAPISPPGHSYMNWNPGVGDPNELTAGDHYFSNPYLFLLS